MTKRISGLLVVGLLASPTVADLTVGVGQSGDTTGTSGSGWLGFMNVFELPVNGGGFVFNSGWGVADLNATFDDPNDKLTLSPNTIGDPDPFWYQGGGGPGQLGNKTMDASLYQEFAAGDLAGETLTFEGTVLSNTFTAAHEITIFIKDFVPDFSSFNASTITAAAGAFSISLALDPGAGRHVQYGFETIG